jgi:hypothetical protein
VPLSGTNQRTLIILSAVIVASCTIFFDHLFTGFQNGVSFLTLGEMEREYSFFSFHYIHGNIKLTFSDT